MPKYIDPSKIRLTAVGTVDEDGDILVSVRDVRNAIMQTPAADVVPKSEYDILKSLITHKEEEAYKKGYEDCASEIFAELELLMKIYTFPVVKLGVVEIVKEPFWCIEPNDFETLKKKYTGE